MTSKHQSSRLVIAVCLIASILLSMTVNTVNAFAGESQLIESFNQQATSNFSIDYAYYASDLAPTIHVFIGEEEFEEEEDIFNLLRLLVTIQVLSILDFGPDTDSSTSIFQNADNIRLSDLPLYIRYSSLKIPS